MFQTPNGDEGRRSDLPTIMNRHIFNSVLGSSALALLATSCAMQSGRTQSSLDDGLLQFVDAAAQQEVREARVGHMQAADERAAAEYRVEHADGDRRVLMAELRTTKEKVKLERERVQAMTDLESGSEATPAAVEALANAITEQEAAEQRIALHEAQIEVLKAELSLAEVEEAHAAAVVDVWKARAIKSIKNEQSSSIDIYEYESREHDCGTEIEIAKIRLWSAQSKVQTLEDRLADEG